jgi:hypothetical protein
MSIFGKLIKTTFDTAEIAVSVVKDAATLGGVILDEDTPYTVKTLKKVGRDLKDIKNELEDL